MSTLATLPLLLLLPLVWRAGFVLARLATREARIAWFVGPGLGLTLWLFAVHAFGLVSHSFFAGLSLGTVSIAALGAVSFWTRVPGTPRAEPTPRWVWIGALVMMALIAGPQLRWEEHDEVCYSGHVAIPAQMETGVYPPRFSYFPQFEYRYHYGINLATAAVSELFFRADPSNTLHVLSILLWGYSFCLFWLLGELWIGGAYGGVAAGATVLLAGGLQLGCRGLHPLSLMLIGDCSAAGEWINSPFISNFLQHAWTLATPLTACILLVFGTRRTRDPWWFGALFVMLTHLALAQIVCFGAVLGAVCAAGCFEKGRLSWRSVATMAALFAAVVLAATHLHGFFTADAEPQRDHLAFSTLLSRTTFWSWVGWHVGSYGVTLPLAVLGLWRLRTERLLVAILALGSLVGANLFLDVNVSLKLAIVAQIALAFSSAAALVWLWERPKLRPLAGFAFACCAIFSLCWTYALTAAMPGLWFMRNPPAKPDAADREAIAYLQKERAPTENVFRTQHADAYAFYGGLPTPFMDYQTDTAHFSRSLIDSRNDLTSHPKPDPEPYLAQSFRWFVLAPNDRELNANLARWVESGRAELRAEFPPLKIFYLKN